MLATDTAKPAARGGTRNWLRGQLRNYRAVRNAALFSYLLLFFEPLVCDVR